MQIKATIGIHAKIKYQIRVINVCTKYFEQKCTFLSVFTHMVSSHANLLNQKKVFTPGGGGTWVFLGGVCAARDSKLAPRSKKNFPKIDTPF